MSGGGTGAGAGRLAVVTGGTAGIGLGIAAALARDGWRVLACARRAPPAGTLPEGAEFLRCDVAEPADAGGLVAAVQARGGALAALVNSAGITMERRTFADTTEEDMRRLFEVNVFGTLRVTRALVALMAGPGAVINLSSTLAGRPRPGSALYSATKGAIERFSAALALDLAPRGLRVHAVAPALVRSRIWLAAGMSAEDYAALLAARGREFPLGRAGEPEDVAELVAYLVSDRAAWLTGTVIPVDGGAMLR